MNRRATWWTALCASVVLVLVSSRLAAADPIQVTSGFFDEEFQALGVGMFTLTGTRGFTYRTRLSLQGGGGTNACNGDPLRCVPGGDVSIDTLWSGPGGTATLEGVTYTRVGGLTSDTGMDLRFQGQLGLPPLADSAVVSTGFTFTGTFEHFDADFRNHDELITGDGTTTVWLERNRGFPGSWVITHMQFSFNGSQPMDNGWQALDVGTAGLEGSASGSNGVFTLAGAGADIWGTADAFRFMYQPTPEGNVDVLARVDSETAAHRFAKAGVMIRESIEPGAPNVVLDVKPQGGVEFMMRSTSGGTTRFVGGFQGTFPIWLKLARRGRTIIGFASDGAKWAVIGSVTLPLTPSLIGLAVTSHDTSVRNTAAFSGVTLSRLPPEWTDTDIGSVGVPGSASEKQGVFTVRGAGSDIGNTADSFNAVTRSMTSGDGEIVARVTAEQPTHPDAKAGIFAGGLKPDAARVLLAIRPGGDIEFMARDVDHGVMSFLAGATSPFPVWLKLVRSAEQRFTGYTSVDGSTWRYVGSATVLVPPTIVAGLAVTSHDISVLATATFDHVAVTATPPIPPPPNLLVKAGFEEYGPPTLGAPGWISDNPLRQVAAKSETNQPHTGAKNGACWVTSNLDCGMYQEVTAPSTGLYSFTIFANTDTTTGLVGVNVNNVTVASNYVNNRGFGNYGTAYTMTFSASHGDVIRVWMYSPPIPGYVVIDDVSVKFGPP